MFIDPEELRHDPDTLEEIEKASLRMVTYAIYDFKDEAAEIFAKEPDLPSDIGEDITREALDKMGMSRIPKRLFGKMDYKQARYIFHPEYTVKQALFTDSKAEKVEGAKTATIQTSQTSMIIRQVRRGESVEEPGGLPPIIRNAEGAFLVTTVFVKYNYVEEDGNRLHSITTACLPNGLLQERYNPSPRDTIWRAGRNAPTRGEAFRVRISFHRLKQKATWRVQRIGLTPSVSFVWEG